MNRRNRFWAEVLLRFGKKSLVLALAIVVALSSVIGGTLAWLIDDTKPITNTFTYGDINIDLDETDSEVDDDEDPTTNTYVMAPGKSITKDPKVTVLKNSKDCWLFVELEKSSNFDSFLAYEMADGWTAVPGEEGVYYRTVDETDEDLEFYVIKDNKVLVKEEVTKEMLNALNAGGAENYPKLVITAYAVQRDADVDAIDTVEEAWAIAEQNADQGSQGNP